MTQEEVIKLAKEAGFGNYAYEAAGIFSRFAATVAATAAATEREACAITAWSVGMDAHNAARGIPCDARNVGSKAANAIRARSAA